MDQEILVQARSFVAPGFHTFAEARDSLEEYFEGTAPAAPAAALDAAKRRAWNERQAELSQISGGDYQKVAATFADIEKRVHCTNEPHLLEHLWH